MRGLILAAGAIVGAAGASAGVRVVAVEGREVPGIGMLDDLAGAAVLPDGRAVLQGRFRSGVWPDYRYPLIVWIDDGAPTELARSVGGEIGGDALQWYSQDFEIGSRGGVFLRTSRGDDDEYEQRLWRWSDGEWTLLTATHPARGVRRFTSIWKHWEVDDGVIFGAGAVLADGERRDGWWIVRGDALPELIAYEPFDLPGAPGATVWSTAIYPFGPSGIAMGARLEQGPGGVTWRNDTGVWKWSEGVWTTLIREGDEAPGTGGAAFADVDLADADRSGNVLIHGQLRIASPVDESSDSGLWLGRPHALRLIAREGDVAPGADGRVFDAEYAFNEYSAGLLSTGEAAFTGRMDSTASGDPDASAVFHGDAAGLRLIASKFFRPFSPFLTPFYFPISYVRGPGGEIVFEAREYGGETTRSALCAMDKSGVARVVLAAGYRFAIPDGRGEAAWFSLESVSLSINYGIAKADDAASGLFTTDGRVMVIGYGRTPRPFGYAQAALLVDTGEYLCPGDINGDQFVDSRDLMLLLGAWGQVSVDQPGPDLNGNTVVSAADLSLLLAAWGACNPPASDFASVVDR